MTVIDLGEYPLTPEGGRACYYYMHYLILAQYMHDEPGWPLVQGITIGDQKDHEVKWFFGVHEQDFLALGQSYVDDPQRIHALAAYLANVREDAVEYLERLDPSGCGAAELAEALQQHDLFLIRLLRVASTVRYIDRAIVSLVRQVYPLTHEADALLAKISVPQKPSFAMREEAAIVQAAGRVRASLSSVQAEAQALHDAYCWASLGYYNEQPRDLSYYEERIEAQVSDTMHTDAPVSDHVAERERFVATLDAKTQALANLASEAAYLKDVFKFAINECQYRSEPIFDEVAKRTSLPVTTLKDMSPEEVQRLIGGGAVDSAQVEHRMKHNVIVCQTLTALETLDGEAADAFESAHLRFTHESDRSWKGRVACRGTAEGAVVVITSSNDFHKMKDGAVLVAINTTPDFVPVMKKAAAIVAEEGGITAHVSVVSREMGIPCVVGIRNITRILRDGDLVEVDAQQGIVTVLERA